MKSLSFNGIVRSTSAHNNADGNCEEIINLRLAEGAWRTVGKKKNLIENVDFEQVYVHRYNNFENFIGLRSGKVTWFASTGNGEVVTKDQGICTVTGNVTFNAITNTLLIRDGSNIIKAMFNNEQYNNTTVELPDIPTIVTQLEKKGFVQGKPYTKLDFYENKPATIKAAKELIRGLINQEKEADTFYTEGYVFLCATYELFDGSETKPTPPILVKLGEYVAGLIGSQETPKQDDDTNRTSYIRVADMKLDRLRIKAVLPDMAKYKDMITKVNIYVTPAFSFYDIDTIDPMKVVVESSASVNPVVKEKLLERGEIERMLFFKVYDTSVASPDPAFKDIKFDNALTTNRTMPVDTSGWLNTLGNMFVYNSRLHLFGIQQKFVHSDRLNLNYLGAGESSNSNNDLVMVCYIKTMEGNFITHCNIAALNLNGTYVIRNFVAFPDSRCYKIEVYHRKYACTPYVINLTSSTTYNFAFYYQKQGFTFTLKTDTSRPANIPAENNGLADNTKILVSEAANPYYFPPTQSYMLPGEVFNLAVNTEQISASQIGQYPLYAFTAEGIYALQTGDGKVLYSNIIPVSAEVAVKDSKALQTKYGIVFVTNSGLKIITGQQIVDLSEPVNGNPDRDIRNNFSYDVITNRPDLLCGVKKYLSALPFEQYIRKAQMGYDIVKDEFIVSDPDYDYSYVYSLKTKTWHKITERFTQFDRHIALKKEEITVGEEIARITISCNITGEAQAGETLTLHLNGKDYTYVTQPHDTAQTIALALCKLVNLAVRTDLEDGFVVVLKNKPDVYNNTLTVKSGTHTRLSTAGFVKIPPQTTLSVCDIREEGSEPRPVVLQTRPVTLNTHGFKQINHAIFRGDFRPVPQQYTGYYLLVSNDLTNWQCGAEAQYNCPIPQVNLSRWRLSQRYFVVMMVGNVQNGHNISHIETEGETTLDNRMR